MSEEDPESAWRASLAPVLQPIALRYGKQLFQCCFHCGLMSEGSFALQQGCQRAVMTLQGANARKTAMEVQVQFTQGLQSLQRSVLWFFEEYTALAGFKQAQIEECSQDIHRALQLMVASTSSIVTH